MTAEAKKWKVLIVLDKLIDEAIKDKNKAQDPASLHMAVVKLSAFMTVKKAVLKIEDE